MIRNPPRTLTAPLVTKPANVNVIPNASTRGHAVGAGNSNVLEFVVVVVELGIMCSYLSASDDVDDQKNNDPYGVNKVPIQGQSVDALCMLTFHFSKHRKKPYQA